MSSLRLFLKLVLISNRVVQIQPTVDAMAKLCPTSWKKYSRLE